MINLEVLGNEPVTLGVNTGNTIQLRSADNPVDSVISVNGKQGVVVLKASDIEGAGVPTNVREAIFTLLNNAAYVTTGLDDEIAIVEAWAEEVTALTLSDSTLELSGSTPQTITATTVPAGKAVSWASSDDSVATVSNGTVTGVANGTCTITASAGSLTATCEVTVSGFATLEFISAVYTQSGTVYDTDSLDSLKADLVVTATYSDTTTATVPSTDYTLSGTLTVGTSTITVSYGGKTTTFNVTVSEITSVVWDYTDGNNGVISFNTTGGGSATFDVDGIHLSSGSSSAWCWAQVYVNLPDGLDLTGKATSVEVEYTNASVQSTNGSFNVFSGSPETTTRIYAQNALAAVKVVGGTGSTNSFIDVSNDWGTFGTSGKIKVTYDPDTDTAEFYNADVLKKSITTTIYNYDHAYGSGLVVEAQRGGTSFASSVIITSIKLEWEG